jgi:hypothetical protein
MSPMNPRLLRPLATGFDPRRIAGLVAWYDASDISTLAQNSNGTTAVTTQDDPVGYLRDKGPNGYHMTQSTNNNRPLVKLSAQNGLAALLFDGADDFLINTNNFLNGAPTSVALVAQRQSDNPLGVANVVHPIVSTGRLGQPADTSFNTQLRSTFASPPNAFNAPGGNARRNGNASLDTGSSPTDFLIGTGGTSVNTNAAVAGSGVHLGAARDSGGTLGAGGTISFRLHGRIGEVALYNRLLSLAERQALERYLSVKWGIALTP